MKNKSYTEQLDEAAKVHVDGIDDYDCSLYADRAFKAGAAFAKAYESERLKGLFTVLNKTGLEYYESNPNESIDLLKELFLEVKAYEQGEK